MPFGLTNAPATFQRLINQIFASYLHKFVLVYLDDILVFSPILEEHQQHLELVAAKLKEHGLIAKPSKTHFQRQIQYLGYRIDGSGDITSISPSPKIIDTLETWRTPSNVKELQ